MPTRILECEIAHSCSFATNHRDVSTYIGGFIAAKRGFAGSVASKSVLSCGQSRSSRFVTASSNSFDLPLFAAIRCPWPDQADHTSVSKCPSQFSPPTDRFWCSFIAQFRTSQNGAGKRACEQVLATREDQLSNPALIITPADANTDSNGLLVCLFPGGAWERGAAGICRSYDQGQRKRRNQRVFLARRA